MDSWGTSDIRAQTVAEVCIIDRPGEDSRLTPVKVKTPDAANSSASSDH